MNLCFIHLKKWQLTRLGMLPAFPTKLRRIEKIAEDAKKQLFERLSKSPWHAIQVEESTDAENQAILLVCVCNASIKMTSKGIYAQSYCCKLKHDRKYSGICEMLQMSSKFELGALGGCVDLGIFSALLHGWKSKLTSCCNTSKEIEQCIERCTVYYMKNLKGLDTKRMRKVEKKLSQQCGSPNTYKRVFITVSQAKPDS